MKLHNVVAHSLGGIAESISDSAYCTRAWSISPSVCMFVTLVYSAKAVAVGWNEMPFGRDTVESVSETRQRTKVNVS